MTRPRCPVCKLEYDGSEPYNVRWRLCCDGAIKERDEARKLAEDYRIFGIEKTMERDEARAKLGEARKLAEQWRNEATGSPSRGTRFPWEEK